MLECVYCKRTCVHILYVHTIVCSRVERDICTIPLTMVSRHFISGTVAKLPFSCPCVLMQPCISLPSYSLQWEPHCVHADSCKWLDRTTHTHTLLTEHTYTHFTQSHHNSHHILYPVCPKGLCMHRGKNLNLHHGWQFVAFLSCIIMTVCWSTTTGNHPWCRSRSSFVSDEWTTPRCFVC